MNLFLYALKVLTILPVRPQEEPKTRELPKSVRYFPLVGLLLGVCLVILEFVLTFFLPPSVVIVILLGFMLLITGGLHLDGFADTVDAIASREKAGRALEIMREPGIGPVGACAVVILLLSKFVSLNESIGARLYTTLLFFPVAGRMGVVTACFLFPYARSEGTGKAFIGKVRPKDFVIAGVTAFVLALLLFKLKGLFVIGFIIMLVIVLGKFFVRKLGGITGDILGFINELCELVALLVGCMLL